MSTKPTSRYDYIRIPIGPREVEVFVQVSPDLNERSLSDVRGFNEKSFGKATDAIVAVCNELTRGFVEAPIANAQLEFGLNFGFEAGELQILLVQGTADASIKVHVEWRRPEPPRAANPTLGPPRRKGSLLATTLGSSPRPRATG